MRRLTRISLMCLLGCIAAGEGIARDRAAPRESQPRAEAAANLPIISDARLGGDAARTRLVMDLDRQIEVTAFVLADPHRVIVDMPEVVFRLSPNTGREGRGLVAAYRFGQFALGRSRIVLDMREPARVDRSFVLAPVDGQPARLVVDLVRTSREEFLADAQRTARPAALPAAVTQARPLPAERRPRSELPLVVLDPGHGGVDAGASSAEGHQEKTIVLEFARALRTALESSGRVRVAMTRDGDTFVRLDDRVRFARERQAVLFLSIHADSFARPLLGVSGASIYTLSDRASDQEAAAYAERENRADLIAGVELPPETDEVADILFDLMHRETKNFSVHFARLLVEELRPHVRFVRNPHRFAGFRVLRAPDVPSALLELGYLSSREDVRLLLNTEWRQRTATAISRAVLGFIASSQAGAPASPPTPTQISADRAMGAAR
jgi:N-acetylmuramoyl-L-alanine amidase